MQITKETLTEDIKKLEEQRAQALGNLNALEGALQFARITLAKFEAPEPKKDAPKAPDAKK